MIQKLYVFNTCVDLSITVLFRVFLTMSINYDDDAESGFSFSLTLILFVFFSKWNEYNYGL